MKERLKRDLHNAEQPVAGPTIAEAIDSLSLPEEISIQNITPRWKPN